MSESASPTQDQAGSVNPRARARGNALFLWATGGVVLLLLQAIYRLSQIAWDALEQGMATWQLAACGVWVLINAYTEGYRGFHCRFVPRVLARAHHLALHPKQPASFIAPLFAMAFFDSDRKAKFSAWAVTIAVMIAIVIVRHVPQPWRGIIDAGVVSGLTVGTLSLLLGVFRRLQGVDPTGSPQLP